jgi:hypothetical protein
VQNLNRIKEISKRAKTFNVGVNKFSDLTWEEFKNAYLLAEPLENNLVKGKPFKVEEIDWREKGIVTRVKD